MAKAENEIGLEVQWTIADDSVRANYELTNNTGEALWVFDRLYKTERSGARKTDPTLAFTRLSSEMQLIVEKRIPELPDDIDVESPIVPYARKVEPDDTLAGEAIIAIPLVLYDAYALQPSEPIEAKVDSIHLVIGYTPAGPEGVAGEGETDGVQIYSVRHAWASQHQRLIKSTAFPIPVDTFSK